MNRMLLLVILLLVCTAPARAELNFCNAAPLTVVTALGESAGGGKWQSRGWWTLKPGECAVVVGGNLTIFNIDATPYIQQVAQPQLDRLAATIDSRIGEIDVSRVMNKREMY